MAVVYDECLSISMKTLKRLGFLRIGEWKANAINWNRNGERISSVWLVSNMVDSPYFVELDYKYNGQPIKYRVQLVSAPSNLKNGLVWYFICPHTGKRCRTLHLVSTYFLHRTAWTGCLYEKQTQSKGWRSLELSILGRTFKAESIYEKIYKKNFKRHYRGKLTNRYLHLLSQLKKVDHIGFQTLVNESI
jgi:hypothetical protein